MIVFPVPVPAAMIKFALILLSNFFWKSYKTFFFKMSLSFQERFCDKCNPSCLLNQLDVCLLQSANYASWTFNLYCNKPAFNTRQYIWSTRFTEHVPMCLDM